MFNDDFKNRYTTIPFAIYQAYCTSGTHEVITHYHREIEIISITEGSAEFSVGGESYTLEGGGIMLVPKGIFHGCVGCSPDTLHTAFQIDYDTDLVRICHVGNSRDKG